MNTAYKIYEANRDLLSRVDEEEVSVKYLKKEDVLLLTLSDSITTDSITLDDGLLIIHYNSDNFKITGFTIPYFQEFIIYCKNLNKNEKIKKSVKEQNFKPLIEPIANVGMFNLSFAF